MPPVHYAPTHVLNTNTGTPAADLYRRRLQAELAGMPPPELPTEMVTKPPPPSPASPPSPRLASPRTKYLSPFWDRVACARRVIL